MEIKDCCPRCSVLLKSPGHKAVRCKMAQAPAVMPGNTLNGMTTVTQFPLKSLVLVVSTLLAGCSTDPAFFDAEAQRHQSAQAPIFECQKCEGVTLRSQIPSVPTVAPTNGWDALSSVGKSASSVISGQAGTILAGYAINALSSSKPAASNPTPVIVNPSTVTTTTTTGDTISTYQANQSTESTVTTSSTSNALDNSGQIAGGDAGVTNSYNPHTETATSTTNNSNNPITSYPQPGSAP